KWKESNSSTKKVTEDKNDNYIETQTKHQGNGSFHAVSSLGLSAIYDFKLNDKFKPYIGARIAYGHVRHQVHSVESKNTIITSKPKNGTAQGGHVPTGFVGKPAYHESHSISSLGLGVIA
ncbi:TPA: Opacity protein opA54, partial [Neisseria meningitidis]